MDQNHSLVGIVTDNNGNAVAGATITLTGEKEPKVEKTNAKGDVIFNFLLPGIYEVKAEMEGFNPSTQRVSIYLNAETTLFSFVLQPAVSE